MSKKPIADRGGEPFVFVSYAHADAELAYQLIAGLQERGLRVWFDDGMDTGDLWDEVIPDHVERCAAVLCLVSSRFTASDNCMDEIHYAKEQKKELLILHLEDETLPRNFQFRYGRLHALRLSDYSDRGRLLDKLAATEKLRCCLGQVQEGVQEPKESFDDLYQKGKTCYEAKSYEEAVKWFRQAADKGNVDAMRNIAFCYILGYGVCKSHKEAAMWYRRAADKGDVMSMLHLSRCYSKGEGVPMNEQQAKYWRDKAKQAEANASN